MDELRRGCWVYGSRGAFVGTVEGAGSRVLRVRGRGPFSPVYYVPRSAVAGVLGDGQEVVLDCRIDDVDHRGWLVPPDEQRGTLPAPTPRRSDRQLPTHLDTRTRGRESD